MPGKRSIHSTRLRLCELAGYALDVHALKPTQAMVVIEEIETLDYAVTNQRGSSLRGSSWLEGWNLRAAEAFKELGASQEAIQRVYLADVLEGRRNNQSQGKMGNRQSGLITVDGRPSA